MPSANHCERIGAVKVSSAWDSGDSFFSGVDQIGINLIPPWVRTDSEQAILGLQQDAVMLEREVGQKRGKANTEVDDHPIGSYLSEKLAAQVRSDDLEIGILTIVDPAHRSGLEIRPLAHERLVSLSPPPSPCD